MSGDINGDAVHKKPTIHHFSRDSDSLISFDYSEENDFYINNNGAEDVDLSVNSCNSMSSFYDGSQSDNSCNSVVQINSSSDVMSSSSSASARLREARNSQSSERSKHLLGDLDLKSQSIGVGGGEDNNDDDDGGGNSGIKLNVDNNWSTTSSLLNNDLEGEGNRHTSPLTPPLSGPSTPARPSSSPCSAKGSDDSPSASEKDKLCGRGGIMTPPREERSAPEGTSSPTPRPQESSAGKRRHQDAQAPPGYLTQAQVDALLKRQEAQFEERLQRVSQSSDQKEKDLHIKMKEEQKELGELRAAVVEVTQSREALLKMLEQYKDMLAAVVKGKSTMDKDQETRFKELETQKNQALEDLANVEAAFSDVHSKYERTKQVVETLKRNEMTLRGAVADYEGKIKRQEATLVTFQQHAEEKMQQASDEYENLKRSTDQELTKMGALLKKAEMKITSLQDQLERKSRDNQELTQLLDDLIAKMGPNNS